MSSIASLRIAVIGSGQIGSAFAFQLARTGHHTVTVVARPGSGRLQQLRGDGGIVNAAGERADVEVADTLDEGCAYDLVIITVLAHQVDAVLPALQRSAARCIQFMFNTFDPERLQDAVGADRCSFGMPFIQASLDSAGRLKAMIGAGGQKSLMSRQESVDVFNAAGLPATLQPQMPLWLRCHAPICVAFESVSAAGMRRGGGASLGEAMVLARGLHASFALIQQLGHPLYPASKAWLNRFPAVVLAAMLWTLSRIKLFRELLATGVNECCALVDVMAAAALQAGAHRLATRIQAMRPTPPGP